MNSSKAKKRRFYSPTQKSTGDHVQQFDEFEYNLERSDCGNTQGTKSGSDIDKRPRENKGILDDMEEDLDNIQRYEEF